MAAVGGAKNALPGSILLVIHDFAARSLDELSLAKGDRIELIERDDEFGDGWFLGKHLTNGANGLFPEVYTTPAPKGTLSAMHNPRASADAASNLSLSRSAASAALSHTAPYQQAQPQPPTANTNASIMSTAPANPRTIHPSATYSVNSDSPVMSETLSVIDEHITDMKTPRSSYGAPSKRDTIGSVYSMHPFARRSYIAGHETDEEESQVYSEAEVMTWSPARVAEYLEDHGVEKSHCDVFKEQDITGEVLLAMDQNSLFIKEFELGSVGRRLKTWHKIKALQEEVKRVPEVPSADIATPATTAGSALEGITPVEEATRSRSSTTGSVLPRALTTKRTSEGSIPPMPSNATSLQRQDTLSNPSPLQSITSTSRPENTYRPSAQDIRNMNRSRRHSSIDSETTDVTTRTAGKKQTSSDKKWSLNQPIAPSNGKHNYTSSIGSSQFNRPVSNNMTTSPTELDRGYFSSTEVESRHRTKNVLSKRHSNANSAISSIHSRNGSYVAPSRNSTHSKVVGSTDDLREPTSPTPPSAQMSSGVPSMSSKFGAFRSATSPGKLNSTIPGPPTVTNLESPSYQSTTSAGATEGGKSSPVATSSPTSLSRSLFSSAKAKVTGLRSISDAVTRDEKDKSSPTTDKVPVTIPDDAAAVPLPTGASTPSTENPSFDMGKNDSKTRVSSGSGGLTVPVPPPSARRTRAKAKKSTSAYTRGLEKKTPAEQMLTCDYAGWMKKKSGSLMTTWKPRLFILRGRRLSYYYSEDDDEEKGLIDISFHRVLPAQNETLTGLHATVTGAGASPSNLTSSPHHTTPTIAEQDLRNHPPSNSAEDAGLFIFKLVPPKAGLAKGVSFTKPTVHYFALNSRQEGRLWMAALMKATIDRDHDALVTTTYNQKTISLATARARRERPPALKEEGDGVDDGEVGDDESAGDGRAELEGSNSERGLGIGGLRGSLGAGGEKEVVDGGRGDASSFLTGTGTVVTSTDAGSEVGVVGGEGEGEVGVGAGRESVVAELSTTRN